MRQANLELLLSSRLFSQSLLFLSLQPFILKFPSLERYLWHGPFGVFFFACSLSHPLLCMHVLSLSECVGFRIRVWIWGLNIYLVCGVFLSRVSVGLCWISGPFEWIRSLVRFCAVTVMYWRTHTEGMFDGQSKVDRLIVLLTLKSRNIYYPLQCFVMLSGCIDVGVRTLHFVRISVLIMILSFTGLYFMWVILYCYIFVHVLYHNTHYIT